MGAIGASAFIFRDFLKYILPTIIAACLFVPFFAPNGGDISVDLLVFVSAISGYIIYSPIAILSSVIQHYLPFRLNLRDERTEAVWWKNNWDYNTLWVRIDKDEREYAYLTQSYFEFYQTMGFYLLLYALANLISVFVNLTNGLIIINDISDVLQIKTQMIGKWYALTPGVLLVSFILSWFMFKDAIIEYGALYLKDGIYVRFSEKYHADKGNIARSVWGQVYHNENSERKPVSNIRVELLVEDNGLVESAQTDAAGRFQIIDAYSRCVGKNCKIVIISEKWSGEITKKVEDKTIPNFDIDAVKIDKANPVTVN